MYLNDTHILIYVVVLFIGGMIGQVVDYLNKTFVKEKKILSKDSFKQYKLIAKPNYSLILINAILYVTLLYKFGVNLEFFRFALLVPMLICAFVVDYQEQIIPNRLNLTMFEIGLIFTFVLGIFNLSMAKDALLGMLAGGGIFLAITLIGGLIAGKEAMGLGDVKLMGALGLYFGLTGIIIISILSFLIGAIISIVIVLAKKNREDGYIPFGPFIVLATIITIFVPTNVLYVSLMQIFSIGLYKA